MVHATGRYVRSVKEISGKRFGPIEPWQFDSVMQRTADTAMPTRLFVSGSARHEKLAASSTKRRMRRLPHSPQRQESEQHKMDERNHKSFENRLGPLLRKAAKQVRVTGLERMRDADK